MDSEALIKYYGTSDIEISPVDIFKFTLNSDKNTANVGLSEAVEQLSLFQIVVPYECEIEGNSYIVTQIDDNAFSSCSNLTDIIIPNSITTIRPYAFEYCVSLKSIKIPNNVKTIGNDVFLGCSNLTSIEVNESNENYSSIDGVLFNKNLTTLILYPMNKQNKRYVIPNSVTSIRSFAFTGNISLTDVTISNSVLDMGSHTFKDCANLSSVKIGSGVKEVGICAFENCCNLITLLISDGVDSIGNYAFNGCESLTNLTFPHSVTNIGISAFENCTGIRWIRFSNNLYSLKSKAFYGCSGLKVIAVPKNVDNIGNQCFSKCTNLKKVIIESENLIIETELETFPVTNDEFKIYANSQGEFKNNSVLMPYIAIWEKYDGLYYYCDGVVDRVIFYDYNLIDKTVILFSSLLKNNGLLKQVDENAFIGCFEMRVLEINEELTIKTNTFVDCENLINVFINVNNVQIEKNAFPLNNLGFTIYSNVNSTIVKNRELQPYIFLFKENKTSYNSHLFIAGVGEVELFKGDDIVLTSKTLIDTGINLTVNLDDIQGNGGAKLYGKYASQAGMTIKLTEAMFRMEFLAANLGEDIEIGGSAVTTETSVVQNGIVEIDGEPLPLYMGSQDKVVWVGNQSNFISFSKDKIQKGEGDNFGKTLIIGVPFPDNTQVCVKYIKEYEEGQTIKVSSNYLPDEMTAILTASLFAGDQNSLETATKVGTLTITIPRLMLSGNSDISMNMTGSSQMNIEGQALAVEESECDEGGYYAVISKIIKNTTWTSNLAGLAIDNANHLKNGEFLEVYGVFYGIGTRPLTKEQYVVLPSNCVDNRGCIIYNDDKDLLITIILKDDSSKITRGIIEAN